MTKLVKSFDEGLIPKFAETWESKNIFNPVELNKLWLTTLFAINCITNNDEHFEKDELTNTYHLITDSDIWKRQQNHTDCSWQNIHLVHL